MTKGEGFFHDFSGGEGRSDDLAKAGGLCGLRGAAEGRDGFALKEVCVQIEDHPGQLRIGLQPGDVLQNLCRFFLRLLMPASFR